MQKALPFIHFPQFPFLSQPKKAGAKSLSRIVRGQQKHLDFFPEWDYAGGQTEERDLFHEILHRTLLRTNETMKRCSELTCFFIG